MIVFCRLIASYISVVDLSAITQSMYIWFDENDPSDDNYIVLNKFQ